MVGAIKMKTLETLIAGNSGNLIHVVHDGLTEYRLNRVLEETAILQTKTKPIKFKEFALDLAEFELYQKPLDELKTAKIEAIDLNTTVLILAGAVHGDLLFSMSINAQANWLKVESDKDAGRMVYPYTVRSKNDQYFQFADVAEAESFLESIANHKISKLGSGWALVDAVKNAVDVAALEVIVDER